LDRLHLQQRHQHGLVEGSFNYDGNIINIINSSLSKVPAGMSVTPFFNNSFVSREVISVSGFGQPYGSSEQMGSAPWHNAAQDFEPKVDVSYTKGKHAMKFGFSYNRYTKNQQLFGDANGTFAFNGGSGTGQFTGNGDTTVCHNTSGKTAGCVIGDGFLDMLLGLASNYDQAQDQAINHYVNQTPSIYAMDNWHVTPRLTLQLGARYDALPHAWERQNHMANFNPAAYSASAAPYWNNDGSMLNTGPGFSPFTVGGITTSYYLNGFDIAGNHGTPAGLVTNDYKTWQPRLGFSEDVSGNGKTVLRGGIGTFFERMQGNDVYNVATTPPFYQDPAAGQVYFSNPKTSLLTGNTVTTPSLPQGLNALATTYKAPAVAMFSLGVQRELAPSLIWVVQYVGNIAWHQNLLRQINTFPLTTDLNVRALGGTVPTAGYVSASTGQTVVLPAFGQGPISNNSNSFRTYQGVGGIAHWENGSNGTYNGFQTGLRIQNRWGLSGEIDYTYSHEIDITSYDSNNPRNGGPSNPWNLKYDKASGELDRRHILVGNYMYKFPFFNKGQGLVHAIAGGWEIAGTFVDETGVPQYPYFNGNDTIGLGGGYTNRPNQSGKTKYPKKVSQWFSPSSFSTPTASWLGGGNLGFGTAGRDSVVGPGRVDFTTSLYKSFAITERAHVDLRFESFNTFNHAEFNNIDSTYNSGTPGAVTSEWGPRVLQLGGKFVF
jgi:hypothetical protein